MDVALGCICFFSGMLCHQKLIEEVSQMRKEQEKLVTKEVKVMNYQMLHDQQEHEQEF